MQLEARASRAQLAKSRYMSSDEASLTRKLYLKPSSLKALALNHTAPLQHRASELESR